MVGILVHGDNHSSNSKCLENGVLGKPLRQTSSVDAKSPMRVSSKI